MSWFLPLKYDCFYNSLSIFPGDLIPRHLEIFSNNAFFKGMKIPEPDTQEPLGERYPGMGPNAMDFLDVSSFQVLVKCLEK